MVKVVKGAVWTDWFPVKHSSTLYVGQLVKYITSGVEPLPAAAAGPAVVYPFGVVVGLNDQNPTYDTTYKTNSSAAVATQALELARKWTGTGGMTTKGEPGLMAQVAMISSNTILQATIAKALDTPPTVVTVTTRSATGSGFTHGASDAASVAYWQTHYCRKGSNRGLYRSSYATSTTTPTFYLTYPYDVEVGDTFCVANVGLGRSGIQFDAQGYFIDNDAATSTNYYLVDVLSLNLEKAGEETATFRFVL